MIFNTDFYSIKVAINTLIDIRRKLINGKTHRMRNMCTLFLLSVD